MMLALKAPAMEALYALKEASPLIMYDSLVPAMMAHQTRGDGEKEATPYEKLVEENNYLKYKIDQQNEELLIVRWWQKVFENGDDSRQILKRYTELVEENKEQAKKIKTLERRLVVEVAKIQKEH